VLVDLLALDEITPGLAPQLLTQAQHPGRPQQDRAYRVFALWTTLPICLWFVAGVREGLFELKGDPAAVTETLQDALFGAMLYAASAPDGAVTAAELEKKWGGLVCALTGWKHAGRSPLLPWTRL